VLDIFLKVGIQLVLNGLTRFEQDLVVLQQTNGGFQLFILFLHQTHKLVLELL